MFTVSHCGELKMQMSLYKFYKIKIMIMKIGSIMMLRCSLNYQDHKNMNSTKTYQTVLKQTMFTYDTISIPFVK